MTDQSVTDPSGPPSSDEPSESKEPSESDEPRSEPGRMDWTRRLSLVGQGPAEGSESTKVDADWADPDRKHRALETKERLRELQESLDRLEEFAAQAQAENTIRAYASDLEDFRHWCKKSRTGVAARRTENNRALS